ncbi:MAG: hypothetical protein ABSB90_08170 [Thermoplasmata archaeon]
MSDERRPIVAFLVAMLGALFILAEGIVVVVLGDLLSSLGAITAGTAFSWIGALVVLFGLILFFLAVGVLLAPEYHLGIGITILVLSLLSFLFGGGFVFGGVLGCIGGALAILFQEESNLPRPTRRSLPSPIPPTDRTCRACGKLFSGRAPECQFCHSAA